MHNVLHGEIWISPRPMSARITSGVRRVLVRAAQALAPSPNGTLSMAWRQPIFLLKLRKAIWLLTQAIRRLSVAGRDLHEYRKSQFVFARMTSKVFPICLGTIGAGLMWRKAAETLGAPALIGEIWLALAVMLYALCAAYYARKFAHRPAAILEDLGPVPARAPLSVASMCTMLTAAALVPYVPGPAALLLLAGVAHHLIHAVIRHRSNPAGLVQRTLTLLAAKSRDL